MSFFDKKRKSRRFIDLDLWWDDPRMFNGIIYALPRSGKTVLLHNMINTYMGKGFTCFLNDCAKGYDLQERKPKSEILMLFSEDLENIPRIRVFVPINCKVKIPSQDFELIQVESYDEIFNNMDPKALSVLSFDSFVLPPLAYARFWALFGIELLFRSKQDKITTPVFGGFDQINHIFPSRALRFSGEAGQAQAHAANWFAKFLMDCSGSGVKVVGTSHGITMVKMTVRNQFHWKWFKTFTEDVSKAVDRIKPAQKLIATLPIDTAYVTDDRSWGDIVSGIPNIPYTPDPVYYQGDHIKDRCWELESAYSYLVPAPKQKNGETDVKPMLLLVGCMHLLGMSQNTIAHTLNKSRSTVRYYLRKLCGIPDYMTLLEEHGMVGGS